MRAYRHATRVETLPGNRWRYELECGHFVTRRGPGHAGCYCQTCEGAAWRAFAAWVSRARSGSAPELARAGAVQAFAASGAMRELVAGVIEELQRRRPMVWTRAYAEETLRALERQENGVGHSRS